MGKFKARQRLTVVSKLYSHSSTGAKAVLLQLKSQMHSPIFSPPERKTSLLILIVEMFNGCGKSSITKQITMKLITKLRWDFQEMMSIYR